MHATTCLIGSARHPLLRELRNDWPLHAVTLAYAIVVALVSLALGATDRFVPSAYIRSWIEVGLAGFAIHLLAVEVSISIVRRSPRPITDSVRRMWHRIESRALPGLALVINLGLFMGVFTSMKTMLPLLGLPWRDRELADLSQFLHLGYVPWRVLHGILGHPEVTRMIEYLYLPVWLVLLIGFPVFLSLRRDLARLRVRYILTMFFCFILLGNVVAAIGLSAGPAFYERIVGHDTRYAQLIQYLAFSSGRPYSAWDVQHYLWSCFQSGQPQLGSGISAFPSLHVAMATLFALAGRALNPWLGRILVLYTVAILLGSVHLGWHYAIDGYASLLGTLLIWTFAGWLARGMEIRAGLALTPPRPEPSPGAAAD